MSGSTTPSQQEGPTNSPPKLPDGYVAQWDGSSKKFYYVETATGVSSWNVPEKASSSVPIVNPTPQPDNHPYNMPDEQQRGMGANSNEQVGEADRSLLTDLASNAMGGGKHNKPHGSSSGLGGLANSFLGGGGSGHGGGSHGGGLGGMAGQLAGSLLGGGKPHNQQPHGSSGGYGGTSGGGGHQQSGGLMGIASGFMGGHHGQGQNNNFGYTSSGHSSNSYSAEAPPATYQPPGGTSGSGQYGGVHPTIQQESQHNPFGGVQYNPQIQQMQSGQQSYHNPSSQYGGSGTPSMSGALHGGNDPSKPHPQQPSYGGPTQSSYNPSNSSTPSYGAGQQHQPSYPPPPSSNPPYPQQQNQSYPPPPNQQPPYGQQSHSPYPQQQPLHQPPSYPSYQGQSQQPQYAPYPGAPPQPPMGSHPSNQGQQPGGYAGQSGYGGQEHGQGGYGHPGQGGYGQHGQTGGVPAPGWR